MKKQTQYWYLCKKYIECKEIRCIKRQNKLCSKFNKSEKCRHKKIVLRGNNFQDVSRCVLKNYLIFIENDRKLLKSFGLIDKLVDIQMWPPGKGRILFKFIITSGCTYCLGARFLPCNDHSILELCWSQ